jgi:Bacterial TniB protein
MSDFAHLSETAATKLLLPDNERILHIKKPRWIGYERARELLDKLEDLLDHPKQPRMPNMLIVGETNNGKSLLVDRFREKHPATENLHGDSINAPVLYIQAPPTPDERGIYNAFLNRLFEPYGRSEALDSKRDRVIRILQRINLRMIIIDELHSLLAGSATKQRACLNVLKYIGNELKIPIVAVGTAEAFNAVKTDPQISNRFLPEILPKWGVSTDTARLLASFERLLPLKQPSRLSAEAMTQQILLRSEGTIGEMSSLLNSAAIYAIKKRIEHINVDVLDKCDYVTPSQRKKMVASL